MDSQNPTKTIKTNSNSSLRINYFPEITYKFDYLNNGSLEFQGSYHEEY